MTIPALLAIVYLLRGYVLPWVIASVLAAYYVAEIVIARLRRPRFPYDTCDCGHVLPTPRPPARSDAEIDAEALRIHERLMEGG